MRLLCRSQRDDVLSSVSDIAEIRSRLRAFDLISPTITPPARAVRPSNLARFPTLLSRSLPSPRLIAVVV